MFLILINLVIFCCVRINESTMEFNVEPLTSCGKAFCENFYGYPKDNITKLIVENESYIRRMQDIAIERNLGKLKGTKKSLCDCKPFTIVPLVGLNVYNTPRFIVNIDKYRQKFISCSIDLTEIEEFAKTPCSDIKPMDNNNYKSMCLPKYQNVILNVVKDEQLYLDEFYVVPMYKCVFVPI